MILIKLEVLGRIHESGMNGIMSTQFTQHQKAIMFFVLISFLLIER